MGTGRAAGVNGEAHFVLRSSDVIVGRMTPLVPVDSVDIQILVDNVTDSLSSVPSFVETEFAGLGRRRGAAWVLGGACLCCAAHGLSCLLTIRAGGKVHTVLFDTGPEDRTFEQNVSRLGVDLGPVEAIVLSHGHWDHAGGMVRALQLVRDRNGGRAVSCDTHPDMFRSRAVKQADSSFRPMEDVPSVAALEANGGQVVSSRAPHTIAGDTVFVSGEIPRVSGFEPGLPGQHRRTEDGTGWEPDELLIDERFIAVNVRGKGLVVLTACSHAGVINVLTHARACFPGVTLHTVLGGLHLSGVNERIIPQTVKALHDFDLEVIAAGHCTGWRAMTALVNAFGDQKLTPLAVGKRLRF
jgi:7,8-dihydropterin-6-yl-methyl-4-(beta-D-ribofuranosyl)aminobenzene 5'-phosphate synthase